MSDDGLPLPATLTITWTKQSGPGTVTFDNPNQAVTAASFSDPGAYVLQLSATDGALTTTSTVAITVQVNTTRNSGWIAAPIDKSTISGQVPVSLVSGITLTSGTLTFYSAAGTNPAVTTLGPEGHP